MVLDMKGNVGEPLQRRIDEEMCVKRTRLAKCLGSERRKDIEDACVSVCGGAITQVWKK